MLTWLIFAAQMVEKSDQKGDFLLVAPVLEKGAASRKVIIPPGKWLADDGQTIWGPAEIDVETPLSRLPHFVPMEENAK